MGLSNRAKEERKGECAHGKDKGVLHMHAHTHAWPALAHARAHSRTLTHAHSHTFNCVITNTCTSTRTLVTEIFVKSKRTFLVRLERR